MDSIKNFTFTHLHLKNVKPFREGSAYTYIHRYMYVGIKRSEEANVTSLATVAGVLFFLIEETSDWTASSLPTSGQYPHLPLLLSQPRCLFFDHEWDT